jgi:hypothetical protein
VLTCSALALAPERVLVQSGFALEAGLRSSALEAIASPT